MQNSLYLPSILLVLLLSVCFTGCNTSISNPSDNTTGAQQAQTGINEYILTNCFNDPAVVDSSELYLFKNGVSEKILDDGTYGENVDLSIDRSKIAYSKGKDASSEIYVMDLATKGETRVTNNAFTDTNPNLSPDSSEVVYWSSRAGDTQLFVSKTDGTQERNIINDASVFTFDPEWSHDGNMIAFNRDTTKTGCKAEIYVGVLNGTHTGFEYIFPVTAGAGAYVVVDPAWSLDDAKLAYSAYEGPGCWNVEGLQSQNLDKWKIKTVEVDLAGKTGKNITTVWSGDGVYVNWLPIWADNDSSILVIRSRITGHPTHPFGTEGNLAKIKIGAGEIEDLPWSQNCYWEDYSRR